MPEDEALEVLRRTLADAREAHCSETDALAQVLARLISKLDAQDAIDVLHG